MNTRALAIALVVLGLAPGVAAGSEDLTVWYAFRAGEADALEQTVNAFRGAHPDVHVRTLQVPFGAYPQKLRSAIPQGAGPDVFVAPNDYLRDQIERELIVAPQQLADATERFAPALTSALTVDGKLWGYPLAYKTLLLFYRRDIVEEPPTTTDELIALAKAHTGEGHFGFVYQASAPYFHAPWLFGFGATLFDGDRLLPFDSPQAIAAADFLHRLVAEEGITPVDATAALTTDMFNHGRAAMVMNGPWFVSEIADGVPWGVAPLPTVSATGLPARPFASIDVLYVTRQGASKSMTRALVDALTSDDAARVRARVGRQPSANRAVSTTDDPLLGMLERQLDATASLPTQPIMQLAWEPYEGALRQIQRGARSPQAALREAFARVEVLARPLPPKASASVYGLIGLCAVLALVAWSWRRTPRGVWRRIVEQRQAYAFLAPAALGMVVLVGVPFLFGVGLGFFELAPGETRFVGVANFTSILLGRDYGLLEPMSFYFTMLVTVLWTITNISIHIAIGFMFALALQQSWVRGRGLFRVLLIVPWAVPNYITGLVFKGLFNAQLGAVNALLTHLGVAPVAWFDSFWPAFAANLVTNVWLGFPFMMVTILGALQAIPADLYEAARVDGASAWRRFVDVTLPLVGPALVPSVVLGTIWTFNMFNVVFLVSEGQPEGATDILVTEAYRWAFLRNGRYGYAAAYSLIIFGILLLYSGLTRRLVASRVSGAA